MGDTSIEWTDKTWNPVRGCSRVSPGCENCYAERVAARFSGPGLPYEGLAFMKLKVVRSCRTTSSGRTVPRWTGKVRMVEEHLADPLRWRKPCRIFVNSMSDLFHESLSGEQVARVFAVMARARWHTFQVLTKRAGKMQEMLTDPAFWNEVRMLGRAADVALDEAVDTPIPNVWLGVSVEDQQRAEERIPDLLATPAAIRFLSVEPLLEPVDLGVALRTVRNGENASNVDWVIVGGESGPGARPCAEEWIGGVIEQCRAARVPVFVKQMGAYVVSEERRADPEDGGAWQWRAGLSDKKGADVEQWPDYLTIREFPGRCGDSFTSRDFEHREYTCNLADQHTGPHRDGDALWTDAEHHEGGDV